MTQSPISSWASRPPEKTDRYKHSYFSERQSCSMEMLWKNQPHPSIDPSTSPAFRRCVPIVGSPRGPESKPPERPDTGVPAVFHMT